MSLYSVNYFYDNIDQINSEIAEICLLGKPPYSLRCSKCNEANIPCLLYAVITAFGLNYKCVYCESCSKRDLIDRMRSGDPDDNGPR
jgi:hypothetical protein